MKRFWLIYGMVWLIFLLFLSMAVSVDSVRYPVQVSADQIYDGDTIKDVELRLSACAEAVDFPGLITRDGQLYAHFDLRIAGIDTPELRPARKGRSEMSRRKEIAAAKQARRVLIDLLASNDYQLTIKNLQLGKYAGRLVGEAWVGDIDIADFLIENGHAKRYTGGRKPSWSW